MNYENGAPAQSGIEHARALIADEPAATTASSTRANPITGIDLMNMRWSPRLVRTGAYIMMFFQSFYLLADRDSVAGFHTVVLPLHLFILLSLALFWIVAGSRLGTLHRQTILLGTCLAGFAATGGLAIATANDEFLVLTLVLVLAGSSVLVPWGSWWQAALSLSSLGTMAAWTLWAPRADPQAAIHWAAIGAAAAFAQLTARVVERYCNELDGQVKELDANHRRLIGEVAERETAVAASEVTNQRLRESEAKLRKIFETSADAITINRLSDGRYLDLNEGFYRAGYSRAETLAQSAGSLGIWASRDQLRRFLRKIISDGAVANFEFDVRTKGGAVLPYLVSATVVELGGEACVVSICRDITTIKQTQSDLIAAREVMRAQIESLERTEDLLRAEILERERAEQRALGSETVLRRIFETSPDAILVTLYPGGRIADFNGAFITFAGRAREELAGTLPEDLGIWVSHDQYRTYGQLLEEKGVVQNLEIELRNGDGAVGSFLISGARVELAGRPCVVSITRDISEFKRTQCELIVAREQMARQVDALRESEKRLRAEITERELAQERAIESAGVLRRIFDTTQVGIAINLAADGRFLQMNQSFAQILGYSREELLRLTLRETGAINNREQFTDFLDELERHGSLPDTEIDLRSRDGAIHPLRVSAVKLEIDGAPCIATIVVDISRRRRIEQELIAAREAALAASQAKSEFLSSMSHEIRTPMNAVQGMADLLWESDLSAEQRRYLETMRSNGNTLLDLINEILDLAKVESGRLHLEQIPLDLRDLTEKLLETLALRAHTKGLELIGRIAPATPTLMLGDPLRLRQILFNLIGNAIKFTQAGEIELTLEQTAPPQADPVPESSAHNHAGHRWASGGAPVWMRFTVRDTGIGIAPAQEQTIFSSFTQADSSTAREYGGSGLGLTIVKRLVELMGGAITVESEPGSGSRFSVTVPLEAQSADDEAIDSEAPAYDAAALVGVRVLLVDDIASSRATLREVLEATGATVEEATDGGEAVVKSVNASTNMIPYNVLLVDERMPGLDGIETVRRIAQGVGGKALGATILMLTTTMLGAEPERIQNLGRDTGRECRYLVKPIKRADLLGAVMEITGRRPREHTGVAYSAQAATSAGGPDPLLSASPTTMRPLRILLADDSPDNRMLIDAYVKKAPYTIDHAEDGSLAVEKVKANHYDLVLMDIQMPVMDGYTAVRTIREWERAQGLARMPIIALTASALDESVLRSLEAGCDAHVSKPVKKATLFEVIMEVTGAAVGGAPSIGSPPVIANGANHMKRQRIHVDADLRDLVPGFLAHKRADLGTIRTAIDRADYETISQIGHKMKGEGGSYGFDAVTAMGAVLEQAALDKNLATARHTLDEFTAYLESVDVVYS